ncbi:unnamed protein product [Ambrosiozyma monospora]|uniref:Unnamed protein product n=1 Tax=Ambrosiozyma monospora TaxID=43982 RepID=A0A9W6YQ23_AMBMO|nr:unnamed protein product [Ambrosiozyma monospora]
MLTEISTDLINICDELIIDTNKSTKQNNESQGVYSTNGRVYKKMDEGNFVRVKNQQKHLIISDNFADFKKNLSIISSYSILKQCGNVLQDHKNLCLAIIFTSREIELNKWYESNTKVVTIDHSVYNPLDLEQEALNYINDIPSEDRIDYVELGCNILSATKINFLQTDHHVMSPTLEGFALREIITKACGYESLKSKDVYNALRAFCHWCSIRGILHCLDIDGLKIDPALIRSFETFPEQPKWIKDTVFARMPAVV